MEGADETAVGKEEPLIPGWIGPDTRNFHRRHKPWYKRRDVRRYFFVAFLCVLVAVAVLTILLSDK